LSISPENNRSHRKEVMAYTASDLPITPEGRIYHLHLLPLELAPDILIVGDPDRVPLVADSHLATVEVDVCHRGLRTITGRVKQTEQRISIVASGMGTPSVEIVLQELMALNEIDFATRERRTEFPRLHIIRVGTAGGLQPDTTLGTAIISNYAVGMDNTGLFYEVAPIDRHCTELETLVFQAIQGAISAQSRFWGKIHPYVSRADPGVVQALEQAAIALNVNYQVGITVANSGFFANQGRDISRIAPTVPELDRLFANLAPGIGTMRFENMEMESSLLLHLASGLGYRSGVICPTIANRRWNTFADDYLVHIQSATSVAIQALANLRSCEGVK
jgi:uridine phosphorylase